MQDLDKSAMGRRIRQIRLAAGLRQWQLARMLGTTQSAVHKYEHGVVPEPRRLIELARIGQTSIEWVLTGTHWESGSEIQRRVAPEVLRTATVLHEIDGDARTTIDEALRILRDALRTLDHGDAPANGDGAAVLRDHGESTLRLLESARRIQASVLSRIADDAGRRLAAAVASEEGDERDSA